MHDCFWEQNWRAEEEQVSSEHVKSKLTFRRKNRLSLKVVSLMQLEVFKQGMGNQKRIEKL